MKAIVSACLFVLVACVMARPGDDEVPTYDTKYDNVKVDEVLGSERTLQGYYNCCMDLGPCTADGKTLKVHITDALQTHCAKCTPKQKEGVEKVCRHLYHNKPEMWKNLTAKYDPNGKYTKEWEEEFDKIKHE